jgi:hypothetical protein
VPSRNKHYKFLSGSGGSEIGAQEIENGWAKYWLNLFNSRTTASSSLPKFRGCIPTRRPWFKPGSGRVEFVVNEVELGQVFSEYVGFPANKSEDCSFWIELAFGTYKKQHHKCVSVMTARSTGGLQKRNSLE